MNEQAAGELTAGTSDAREVRKGPCKVFQGQSQQRPAPTQKAMGRAPAISLL